MVYDFHTHTTLSDGVLLPMELIRRCIVSGYAALGIADHSSASTMSRVIREARLAAENGVFIEITAKEGHCLGNGRVARVAQAAGARLLVNSDAHVPAQILTEEFARRVALLAGLEGEALQQALVTNPEELLARARERLK